MPSSLLTLVATPPSGRTRPVLIDADRYAAKVVLQGAPIPWTDIAALTNHVSMVTSLLGPDAVWVDAAAFYTAYVAASPGLADAMGARSRTGFPMRTMLGDDDALESFSTTVRTIADATGRRVVLRAPSPARWLCRTQTVVGKPIDDVDDDQADGASMYLAEWLGRLGSVPVAVMLLDGRPADGDPVVSITEGLTSYSALVNVASHFGWTLGIRDDATVEVGPGEPSVGILPEAFWTTGAEVPECDVIVTTIPPSATPEDVLDRLVGLA